MPAPLAKGLIISLSVLFAAGIAVYENPQVRLWVDSSRRKIALALHSLGDEIHPPSPLRAEDPSTREDGSAEAAERRRKAREEILERGRVMEERRQKKHHIKSSTFDNLVDRDGSLKGQDDGARTTAAEPIAGEEGLRRRNDVVKAAALGAAFANPFADEMHTSFVHEDTPKQSPESDDQISRGSSETLPAALPPAPQPPQQGLLIDTEELSNHTSGQLVDLTPTASSPSPTNLSEISGPRSEHLPLDYWSVNEWAENTNSSFYSPPPERILGDEEGGITVDEVNTEASDAGSEDDVGTFGQVGSQSDLDVLSEAGDGVDTPGSWTEVGSSVSGGD
ncbi:MAG: hypothetical protein FRX48_06629 [Lasallia pustulata]|uniref:Uncharacterized protein n=1 Tax=Lasallia pustulata TaxID=136370 RepID=A0A5M8PM44_9LECA|nr:MAG: hypothetical protein FRX48_06629 [Lasallia pustulata]